MPVTDHHIHIGQFNEIYYDAQEVFAVIEAVRGQTGISRVFFSSTSSCRDDVELRLVEEEIAYALANTPRPLVAEPYLWFVPRYAEQGISVQSAVRAFDYCGIKLHPYAQKWNESNTAHSAALHQIFRWASDNAKPILIHCGSQPCDAPARFLPFFREYPAARVILAHSNPVRETSELVNARKNIFCDTACVSRKSLRKLVSLVHDRTKILFGSDFPITHYWNTHLFEKTWTLAEEYAHDCVTLEGKTALLQ